MTSGNVVLSMIYSKDTTKCENRKKNCEKCMCITITAKQRNDTIPPESKCQEYETQNISCR